LKGSIAKRRGRILARTKSRVNYWSGGAVKDQKGGGKREMSTRKKNGLRNNYIAEGKGGGPQEKEKGKIPGEKHFGKSEKKDERKGWGGIRGKNRNYP